MNSCGVQWVVFATFKGLMTDFVVLGFPLWMAFVAETFLGLLTALDTLGGADLVFDFTDFFGGD